MSKSIGVKRRCIQVVAAVLYNCNFKGFGTGHVLKSETKGICVPGLNCYSCPGAIGACPLGSFQSALLSSGHRGLYYVLGLILLFSILLGRLICGFLCPFGLIQDILSKIPVKKIKKNKVTRVLSYLKYVILVVFAIILPLTMKYPGFCKFICPAGTLEGGIPLVLLNDAMRPALGWLFRWKFLLLIICILSSVFIYRPFCKYICPLGAFYALFQKVSLVKMVRVNRIRNQKHKRLL